MPQRPMHEVEKRRVRIARRVARGQQYPEIAEAEGVSISQVEKDYRKFRESRAGRLRSDTEAAYFDVLGQIEEGIRRGFEEIANPLADAGQRAQLLRAIDRLIEKKARLFGLIQGPDGQVTNNILQIVHPGAAEALASAMSPEDAKAIEATVLGLETGEVIEGEVVE